MRYSVVTLFPLALALAACGNDSGQQAAAPADSSAAAPAAAPAEPAPAAAASAAAPQVASEATAAPVSDEEVVYDPIDVSKLQSSWWEQYNKGA